MNPFKSGVARLALITGAPIVPATITGGGQVWPKRQFLPMPGPIRVTFHEPIRVTAESRAAWRRDRELEAKVIQEVLDSIHQTLGPARRAEERIRRLWRGEPKPPSLWIEGIPFYFFALAGWLLSADVWLRYAAPALPALLLLLAVLVAEQLSPAGHRPIKRARHPGPWIALLALGWAAREPLQNWELACSASAFGLLAWTQVFRFSAYRRVRAAALVLGYCAWLLRLKAVAP
jgi:hypothetical protein